MPTRICRWVTDHPIAFALIFFAFYFTGFFTLEQLITEPVYLIHCTLDDWIPFNEWFIFAYGSWFFLIPWALITLLRRDRSNYFYLCAVMFSGMAICLLLYLLFPNGLNLRPQTIPINNPAAWLVQTIWSMDTSTNVCPSIHVFVSATIGIAAARAGSLREHKAVRRGILTLTILICMSTMFLKQHSAVDVVCGLILSVVLDLLVRRWNPGLGLLRLVVRPRAGGRTVMET